MLWLRRLFGLGLLVGVWYFGWQFAAENQTPVTVNFVAGQLEELPLWKVLLAAFGGGAGIVVLYHLYTSTRNGLVTRRYRKTIGGLESEVHQLRNLPLAPEADAKSAAKSSPDAAAVPALGNND